MSGTECLVTFTCNICGASNRVNASALDRELVSCECGSTIRWRSVIAALSLSLFGKSLTIDEFPERPEIVGLGMSDWFGYASRLATKFHYINTFYADEPSLDLTQPLPAELAGTCDFVISSDVLEHVAPPYEAGLARCRELLKPGGYLILTVPMKPEGPTDEHFPDLFDYRILTFGQDRVLVNRTKSGSYQLFEKPVFHGGSGLTLEMRVFSVLDLLNDLQATGFVDIARFDAPIPEHGIRWDTQEHENLWNNSTGWPVIARAPLPGDGKLRRPLIAKWRRTAGRRRSSHKVV